MRCYGSGGRNKMYLFFPRCVYLELFYCVLMVYLSCTAVVC